MRHERLPRRRQSAHLLLLQVMEVSDSFAMLAMETGKAVNDGQWRQRSSRGHGGTDGQRECGLKSSGRAEEDGQRQRQWRWNGKGMNEDEQHRSSEEGR